MFARVSYFNKAISRIKKQRIKYGARGSFPIDQTSSMPFNIDPDSGRPMSDIQKLVKIQNDVNMMALFSHLPELKSSYLDENMTDEDAVKFLKSRYCQTKSELTNWKTKLAEYQVKESQKNARKKAMSEKMKQYEEMSIKFENELKKQKSE